MPNPVINHDEDFRRHYRRITATDYVYYPSGNIQTKTVTALYIAPTTGAATTETWVKTYTWDGNGLCTKETGYIKQ